MDLGLGIKHWECRYGPYQVCTNDYSGLTLTYFRARSNLIPNAFTYMGKTLEMFIFHKLFKLKHNT